MGKVVVKRFLNDRLGAGASAIARWANKHNARVVSQSVSNGWITVTFELVDKGSLENSAIYTPRSPSTTVRQATDEDLRDIAAADKRREAQERHVTITYLQDPEGAESEKPKNKRWWKR